MRVPSDNPPGDCARHAEAAAALLERLGFAVERHPVPAELVKRHGMVSVTNLVVRERFGRGQGPVIALNAHGDVVPPGQGWTHDPYGAEEKGGAIYGRGAAVSKSDFATYAFALLALKDNPAGLDGTVELHLTYDEETGGFVGPKWLLDEKHQQARSRDQRGLFLCGRHRAQRRAASRGHGEGPPGACRHAGKRRRCAGSRDRACSTRSTPSASGCASERRSSPASARPRSPSGLISGGINTNVVPDRIVMRLDRRLIPEENGAKVEKALIALIKRAAKGKGISVECRRVILAEPLKPSPASSGWSSRCSATPSAS